MSAAKSNRPMTLLIAALGGEGGGVLSTWLVNAATQAGFPVQSTSIPGVAQRTGATTYYLEIFPTPAAKLRGKRPVLALAPSPGDVDMIVASELLEAGRAIAGGYATSDRTTMIASTSRFYVMHEKIAMGDGRYDSETLIEAIKAQTKRHLLFDMERAASDAGAIVNSVMLGAIAGSGRLPIPVEAFEAAIREDGKAVESNLRGFQAGLAAVRSKVAVVTPMQPGKRAHRQIATLEDLEQLIATATPAVARDIIVEGARRLTAYQDLDYAKRYYDRLERIAIADAGAGAGGKLVRETARHLAVRMSYEDVIRVAQAKIDPARFARIAGELKLKPGQPYTITEFVKPGIDEICSILPPWLARPILDFSKRRGWLDRVYFGMHIPTTTVAGYLRFKLLAKLRPYRPRTHRFAEEQAAIEHWLDLIERAARKSGDLALEVVECARLIKGYGDTHRRGTANYRLIEKKAILRTLDGHLPVKRGIDAIASARTAALVDPDGQSLASCLAELDQQAEFREAAE